MNTHTATYTSSVPAYAFVAYFFILSFFPFDADIIKWLCLLTVIGCWTVKMISEKKILFTRTTINIPILLFFLCLLAASFHSVHIKHSLETLLHDYLIYFIIFFCMVNTVHGNEQINRVVKAMLIICGLVCAYGLYGYYTGIAIRDGRLIASFEYHSRVAKYISLLLPIAVCLFFYYRNMLIRLYMGFLIFACVFSLILTMNRTSWVAITVTIIFIGFAVRKKFLIFLLLGICALLVFMLPSRLVTHARTISQFGEFFASPKILGERLLCWKASVAIIKDHPLLGIGPGKKNFRNAYLQYREKIKETEVLSKKETAPESPVKTKAKKKNKTRKIDSLSHAHNIFLCIWIETGIFGLAAFLWLFVSVFYTAIKSWWFLEAGREKMLLMGITAGLISIFLHGLTDSFWKKPDALFLWYIIGILFVVIHNITQQCRNQRTPLFPPFARGDTGGC